MEDYNVAYMNQNPHYGVPLDALHALESEGMIGPGKLYPGILRHSRKPGFAGGDASRGPGDCGRLEKGRR